MHYLEETLGFGSLVETLPKQTDISPRIEELGVLDRYIGAPDGGIAATARCSPPQDLGPKRVA